MSVYAVRGDGKASNEPVHKEKICVPVSGIQNFSKVAIRPKRIQKPRYILYWHKDSAAQKGIGQSFDLKRVALVSNTQFVRKTPGATSGKFKDHTKFIAKFILALAR